MIIKSFILSLSIISRAWAVIPSIINLPNQEEHTRYYLNRYWQWQNQHLFDWNKYLSPMESRIVKRLIQTQKQWLVILPAIQRETMLIGYHWKKGETEISYSLALYVPQIKDLEELAKIYKIRDISKVDFISWRTSDHALCFGSNGVENHHSFTCYSRKNNQKLDSFFERNVVPGSSGDNLFHDSVIHEREIVSSKRRDLFYFIASSQFTLLPEVLKPIVVLHGTEARLPFDKIMLNNEGDVSIFYP